MSNNTKRVTIRQRIMYANVLLIIVPMAIIGIVGIGQVSTLGRSIGSEGSSSVVLEEKRSLSGKVSDIVTSTSTIISLWKSDLDRIAEYCGDLLNERVNITGTRLSYNLSSPPSLVSSSRYGNRPTNTTVSDYTSVGSITPEISMEIELSSYLDYIFQPIQSSNDEVIVSLFVSKNGLSRAFPYVQYTRNEGEDLRDRSWYVEASENDDTILCQNSSFMGPCVILARSVRYDNGSLFGVVATEMLLSSIRTGFSSIDIYSSGYVGMCDDSGESIAHPGLASTTVSSPLSSLEGGATGLTSAIGSGTSGNITYDKDGESWFFTFSKIAGTGYVIFITVPENELLEPGDELIDSVNATNAPMVTTFVAVMIGIIVIIIVLAILMSSRITMPIKVLTGSIDDMVRGDLTREISIDKKNRKNEIGLMASSFQALLVTMRLGNKSYYQGDVNLAFKNYNAALELFKTTKNIKGEAICLNNLGNIYRTWGDMEKAREHYDASISIARDTNDEIGLSSRLNNLALVEMADENYEQASNLFKQALDLDKKSGNQLKIAMRKRNIGVMYLMQNNLKEALKHINEAVSIDEEIGNEAGLADDRFQLGRVKLSSKDIDGAKEEFKIALELANEHGNKPLVINILKMQANIHDEIKDTAALHETESELVKLTSGLGRPKDVIFVIDLSGSMGSYGKIGAARKGAMEVYRKVINKNDFVAIVGFHSLVTTILPMKIKEGNENRIETAIKKIENEQYNTAFYDAMGETVDMFKDSPPDHQRWIVALTDGEDNESRKYNCTTLADKIKKTGGINVILIGVGSSLDNVDWEMKTVVGASPRGKYIRVYKDNAQKEIAKAFSKASEIMASSEIEGFTPE